MATSRLSRRRRRLGPRIGGLGAVATLIVVLHSAPSHADRGGNPAATIPQTKPEIRHVVPDVRTSLPAMTAPGQSTSTSAEGEASSPGRQHVGAEPADQVPSAARTGGE